MGNKYTGEVVVEIGGAPRTIVYTWRALAALQTAFDNAAVDKFRDLNILPLPEVATILSIGLQKHHPELTQDRLLDTQLPLVPIIKAIDTALAYAYFGAGKPEPAEENAPEPTKKKTN